MISKDMVMALGTLNGVYVRKRFFFCFEDPLVSRGRNNEIRLQRFRKLTVKSVQNQH